MRVLVCGGRTYGAYYDTDDLLIWLQRLSEYQKFNWEMNKFACARSVNFNPHDNWLPTDIEIVHGGARGADTLADVWATACYCKIHEFKADWEKYGKSAGYIRNKQMLDEGRPDLVIAFPGGKGTAMMVDIARKAGVEVIIVS